MNTTSSVIRIPVCNSDDIIVERADAARARRLALASNVTLVRARNGVVVRILMGDVGGCYDIRARHGDPRKYTFLDRSEQVPQGVHSLRYLPGSTAPMYRTAVTDLLDTSSVI